MTNFVAPKSKLYAYKVLGESGDKKCIVKMLDFKNYTQCLFADMGKNVFQKQLMFWSRKHKIHAIEVQLTLSRDDDKRVIQSDGVSMLSYRYKKASAMGII